VDFTLSPEQQALQENIRVFLRRELEPLVAEYEGREAFPIHLLPALGDVGLLSLSFPPEYGGSGGHLEVVLLTEEMARVAGGVCSGVLTHCIGAKVISRFGTLEQIERILLPALRGRKVCAIAITEPDHGSDVAGLETEAIRDGDYWRLRGHKMFITNSTYADVFMVMCRTRPERGKDGISMILVEKGSPGLVVDPPLRKLGWHSSDTTPVHFDDCLVPAENLLGVEGRGFYQLMEGFVFERVIMAAMGVGAAQCALEGALAQARQRRSSLPRTRRHTIRHRLADMAIEVEMARLLTYWAAWQADQGPRASSEAATAKLFSSEVAQRVAAQAVGILAGHDRCWAGLWRCRGPHHRGRDLGDHAPHHRPGARTLKQAKGAVAAFLGRAL